MLPILVEGAAAFGSKVVFIALSVKGLYDGLKAYRYAAKIGDEKGKSIALFNIALNGISLAGSLLLLVSEAHYFTSLSAQFLSVCATTVVSLFGIYYLMAITLECQKLYRTYQLKKQLTAKEDVDLAWNYLQHLYAPAANVGQDGELGLSTQSVVKSMQVAEQDLKRYMTQEGFEAICTAFNQHEENPSEKEKKALIEKTISELNKQQMCSAIHILGNLIAMSGTILGQVVSCGIASLSLLFVGGVVTFVASAFAEKGKQPEAKAADATRAQFGRELDSRALS
jgi:hypothetical protein